MFHQNLNKNPTSILTIITKNDKTPHILNLINQLRNQNIPIFIQSNQNHLEAYFASQRQRKFVVVDNFDGDVILGASFSSKAIYLIGYPLRKKNKNNIYCQIPSQIVQHYQNFIKLGQIDFGKRRRISDNSQISKFSSDSQSKIRLKSVMRIMGNQSTSSLTSLRKGQNNKYFLVYIEGNENNQYLKYSQQLSQKINKAKNIKTIAQLKKFYFEKKRQNVYMLISDLNVNKILKEIKYQIQIIVYSTVDSKCIHFGEDSRVFFSSTRFQEINKFINNLDFPIRDQVKKVSDAYDIQDSKIQNKPKSQKSILKPKRIISKKYIQQTQKKQNQQNINNEQNDIKKRSQSLSFVVKQMPQTCQYAVQSSLSSIKMQVAPQQQKKKRLRISSDQYSICEKSESQKNSYLQVYKESNFKNWNTKEGYSQRQSSTNSIKDNLGQENKSKRSSSSNINVNIIMKPSYPQNQYKITQEYGLASSIEGNQRKIKVPKLNRKTDKFSDCYGSSPISISSNSPRKIILKKKLISPEIQKSSSSISLNQSIKNKSKYSDSYHYFNDSNNNSKKRMKTNYQSILQYQNNSLPYQSNAFQDSEYFRQFPLNRNTLAINTSPNFKQNNIKRNNDSNVIKTNKFQNTFSYFQSQNKQKRNQKIVFLIDEDIYLSYFDKKNQFKNGQQVFIHRNKRQLNSQILKWKKEAQFVLIASNFYTQLLETDKVYRIQVDQSRKGQMTQTTLFIGNYNQINHRIFKNLNNLHENLTFSRIPSEKLEINGILFDKQSALICNMVQQLKEKKTKNVRFYEFSNNSEYMSILMDAKNYEQNMMVLGQYSNWFLQQNQLFKSVKLFILIAFGIKQIIHIPHGFQNKVKIIYANQQRDPFIELQEILQSFL